MQCPKCHSNEVHTQVVSETITKKKHSPLYWIFVGWWWEPIMWIFLTIPMLIYKLFRPKKYKTKTLHKTMATCQECGNTWTV